ncbi:MAG: magnesium-translocating P-type ATPase [Candidatus Altiarchaeia archaeon]
MPKDSEYKAQKTDYDYLGASKEVLFIRFGTSEKGLSDARAERRLRDYGPNDVSSRKNASILFQFVSKAADPLVVVLLAIAAISLFFGEKINAVFVSAMAAISVVISFVQEYRAGREAEKLKEMVHTSAEVCRGGELKEKDIWRIVPGDIIELSAGDMVPADVRLISSKDLFIDQSTLTGESFPVEKNSKPVKTGGTILSAHTNVAFMGSSIVSGTATGIVIRTGRYTEFGKISERLARKTPETSFDRGIKAFTWFMIRSMLLLVVAVFAINSALKGDYVEALLFSLAVAVGLTPEMLPMLVTVNLSKGALSMAKKKVIVKRLHSIQNFGAMDTLCTDKTGTLTLNEIVLEKHVDVLGNENEDVLRYAYINSFYQTGLKNLLDMAILKHQKLLIKEFNKIDEIPYDFERKLMSVVVESEERRAIITKGADEEIFKRCNRYILEGEIKKTDPEMLKRFREEVDKLQLEGFRVLAVAYKDIETKGQYCKTDESNLILKGYVSFLDPPKPDAANAIEALKKRGIDTIVLTGDNELVTKKICGDVGLDVKEIITGDRIEKASEQELRELVKKSKVFARLSPIQKEKIIKALQKNGCVVGYLGDGINDAPSLKAADVGISVNNAVDVAKESADMILLEKNLMVLEDGVIEGRKTFGNILKYLKMSSSSNYGNMFSMIGASIFLPFLPMTPLQILLNNFLYDTSQIAIPTDEVDPEYINRPRPWNVGYVKKYMLTLGPISSIFDYATFAAMWFILQANTSSQQALFHTGWFIESLCTQTLVVYIIRTGKNPLKSTPSRSLMLMSATVMGIALILPYTPLAEPFGLVPMPQEYYIILAALTAAYLLLVQEVKNWFIKKYGYE